MDKKETPEFTYKKKRLCKNCKAPISDQEHATTVFCKWKQLSDGTVQSCKDDFHAALNKKRNVPYKKLALFHKDMNQRIEKLLSDKGEAVSAEQLNQYGVRLDMPVQLKINENQQTTFYFIGFSLAYETQSIIKIAKYENSF